MNNNIDLFKAFYDENFKILNSKINEFNSNLVKEENELLRSNLEIFSDLNTNGKLIRGILINLGYKLMGNYDISYSMNLALAYELFQTSILIHDDIIDCDNLRRGKKTVHYANYENYSKIKSNYDIMHLSNSVALCIGDYGLYLSNQCIIENYKFDKNLGNILSYFNNIVLKTIKGELIDTILPFKSKYNLLNDDIEENVISIYKLKTAYYTIIGPICLGMILSGCDKYKIEDITKFGEKIGIAYQIQDDILGIYLDGDMGKIVGSDIKEFKQTIMYSYIDKYKKDYKNELLQYYGNDLTDDSINNVRKIFIDSGAKKYAENLMNNLYDEGKDILLNINWISEENKKILYGFIDYLKGRKK